MHAINGESTSNAGSGGVKQSLEEELGEAGDEVTRGLREKQRAMIDSLDLSK